ncbi:nucleotidyltransferase family protein [Sphingomonas sp.]|uniref:nucleotidyltransferase domain-containing protein n=1 Tax=Sphingomonas sp. TaxID=28214 RepID=UPI0035C7EB1B
MGVSDAALLVRALAEPETVLALDVESWTALLTMARAERLIGSLAERCAGLEVPVAVSRILADARDAAVEQRRAALWEAEMARRALAPLGCPVVLLKGTAYAAAGLAAGQGRFIGDLDILVPRGWLDAVERALLAHGWEWVKPDPYDDAYYRRWMHELPPLIHRERDRMIDVHHTILPLTARPKPDAAALVRQAVPLDNRLEVLSPEDMVVHATAHLFADGDLAGGLRNLWDIDRLVREFGEEEGFEGRLLERARLHQLTPAVERGLRLSHALYGTPVPERLAKLRSSDRLFRRRLLARDGWGRPTRPVTELAFYVRSHWLRMPPAMLARHLWIKWRRGGATG